MFSDGYVLPPLSEAVMLPVSGNYRSGECCCAMVLLVGFPLAFSEKWRTQKSQFVWPPKPHSMVVAAKRNKSKVLIELPVQCPDEDATQGVLQSTDS